MKVLFTEQERLSPGGLRVFGQGNILFVTADSTLETQAELGQCWAAEGSFVFLGACTLEEGRGWLAERTARPMPRMVWLESAAGPFWEQSTGTPWLFGRAGFRLVVPAGATVVCQEDRLLFNWPKPATPASILTRGMTWRAEAGAMLCLGMNGQEDTAGAFLFDLPVDAGGENVFEKLGAGLHFSTEPANVSRRAALRAGFLEHLYSPVFSCKETVTLKCRICPAAWHDPQRTRMELPEHLILESRLCTPEGTPLRASTRADAALVLEQKAVVRYEKNKAVCREQLGLSGTFELSAPQGEVRLLCGLSGTEYLSFAEGKAAVRWVPGQPAALDEQTADSQMGTAAYLSPVGGGAYHTQAAASPFYWPDQAGNLVFAPLALCSFGEEGGPSIPLFPYAGAKVYPKNGQELSALEQELARNRLAVLAAEDRKKAGAVYTALSPVGLMAGLSGEKRAPELSWIALGNPSESPAQLPDLRLEGLGLSLRAGLLSVSPTGYYDSAAQLQAEACIDPDRFRYEICGWKLLPAPQFWGEDGSCALLFQYGTGQTLRQKYGACSVVKNVLSCAVDENGIPRREYQPLVQVLDDPSFQGTVFLNSPVQVDRTAQGFCPEWSILLNSIDENQLKAQYCIVYQSSCTLKDGVLQMGPSQMDALVDYQMPASSNWNDPASAVRFRTVGLRLSMHNGAIQSLESEAELFLAELFGSSCQKEGDDSGDTLLIKGVFSGGVQRFALQEPGMYDLTGSALEKVSIESVLCSAVGAETCFVLGGKLYFQPSDQGDVFSYGMGADGTDCGLRFEGLRLYQSSSGGFTPSWTGITLRPGDSTPRPGSLALCFPVELAGFRSGTTGSMPADQGFFSIRAPLQQGTLSGQWFGLEYRLNLGSLGGLGDDSSLVIRLLFGWAPGPVYYVGVNLGAVQWELLGVFSCGFSSVGLDVDLSSAPPRYSMTLEQFALRLLGARFPPGSNALCLFAGEDGRRLGWYAVYQEEKEKEVQDHGRAGGAECSGSRPGQLQSGGDL